MRAPLPLLLLAAACGSSASGPDLAQPLDLPVDAARELGQPDRGAAKDALTVDGYCERLVDAFCPFYLRCKRIVAADLAGCRKVFLESCNARYEPVYAALVKAGLLELSASAVAACEAHLEGVACEAQLHDLDGPCAVWVGTQAAGKPCGLGVESLVCAPGTACVLGLDLCGSCKTKAAPGGACGGELTCGSEASCLEGKCVPRGAHGAACGASAPCVIGASCEAGFCAAPTIVSVGEACDSRRRCPYRATCIAGTCREDALLGEACGAEVRCTSGFCDGGSCKPLLSTGQSCGAGGECLSSQCKAGSCGPTPGACFNP